MDRLRSFGTTVSNTVTPFATRSGQWIKEQTSTVEKTELPHDYVELETRIEALKATHQKLLAVTSQYSMIRVIVSSNELQDTDSDTANEAYDYPPNIRESFTDLGKSISEKVSPHLPPLSSDS